MATIPEPGQQLPDVEFITESEEKLATGDLSGQKTVLYFYPKDDTPGCTKEACAFRDRMGDYEQAGIRYSPSGRCAAGVRLATLI